MPYKPKKPCKFSGCPKLTHGSYCDEHEQTENRRYNKYQRDPESKKRYGSQWKKIRDRYIKTNPLCELCKESGKYTPADTVHHKQKLSDGGTHDTANLQALCHSCHNRIHGFEKANKSGGVSGSAGKQSACRNQRNQKYQK